MPIGDQDEVIVVSQAVAGEPRNGVPIRHVVRQVLEDAVLVEFLDDVRVA
jgi:hypothetical protein